MRDLSEIAFSLAERPLAGVVAPAQPLMVIVPRDYPLDVDA